MKKPTTKAVAEPKEIGYEEALDYARALVVQKYGTVRQFLDHEDFTKKCGFALTETHKVATYLSKPTEGGEKKVKSAPFLNKLLGGLVGVEFKSGRQVIHTTHFYISQELPPLPAAA
jgi:hypothetical protein